MNYNQLNKANALYEKVKMTQKFQKAFMECKDCRIVSNELAYLEINGCRYSVTSTTYEKMICLLDNEVNRYEKEFDNYLSVEDEVKDNHALYNDSIEQLAQLAINLQLEYKVPMQLITNHIAYGIAHNETSDTIIDNIKNKRDITDVSPIANVIMNKVNEKE